MTLSCCGASAWRAAKATLAVTAAVSLSSCGFSLYSSITPEDSDKALFEKAILDLDKRDFVAARASLGRLWKKEKSNTVTQLYANAILGSAGFDLYDIIVRLLKSSAAGDVKSANDLLSSVAAVVTVDASDAQLDELSLTLNVLGQAENQDSPGLELQKCLTVGIYALPVLDGINVAAEDLQAFMDTLPARLAVNPGDGRTCGAGSATVVSVGQDLNQAIAQVGEISARIAEVYEVLDQCSLLSDAEDSDQLNILTTRMTTVLNRADRGCTIPASGQVGGGVVPSCMDDYVAATATDAAAGDGQVAGCELFVHCSQGGCF